MPKSSALPLIGLVGIFAVFSVVAHAGVRTVRAIRFNQDVSGHLKLAADANSIDLAEHELRIALDNLEDVCAQPGYTSVLYNTPDEDVSFWCANLQATHDDLVNTGTVDNLTESNQLIKVRETLLDHGADGDSVTCPSGISIYPHNGAFMWWHLLSLLGVSFLVFFAQPTSRPRNVRPAWPANR